MKPKPEDTDNWLYFMERSTLHFVHPFNEVS